MTFNIKVTVSATLATLSLPSLSVKAGGPHGDKGGWNSRTPRKGRALYSATREKGSNQGFYTATRDKGLLVSDTAADNMRAAVTRHQRMFEKTQKDHLTWHWHNFKV